MTARSLMVSPSTISLTGRRSIIAAPAPSSSASVYQQAAPRPLRRLLAARAGRARSARRRRASRRAARRARRGSTAMNGTLVGRVRGERRRPSGVDHLLGVAVVGGDERVRRPRRARPSTTRPTPVVHRLDGRDRRLEDRPCARPCRSSRSSRCRRPRVRLGSPRRARRSPRARSSRAAGRRSRTFGLGTRTRSSPAFGVSAPPLKKNVTCAYFSVSAMCSCRRPASASTSASTLLGQVLGEGDRRRDRRVVLGEADEAHAGNDGPLEPVERRVDERARDLARPVGAEVEEDDRVAVLDRATGAPSR